MNDSLRDVTPYDALPEMQEAAAEAFVQLAQNCISAKGSFSVSLSGGSTPKRIYELIAERDLPWDKTHWFWGDERNVPHDHADSNTKMVHEALLDRVPVPKENIHAVPVNVDSPATAAAAYEATLRNVFGDAQFPHWDLALLGMGDDAHTASLFPGTKALKERERWFVENWVEKFDGFRYTLTAPAINSADQIWFLVSGAGKRDALANVCSDQCDPEAYPSQLISPTRWFVTRDAT
ncbi:MAG: 6-phosphogluconolactonase [Rubripirellula sp.]